MDDTAIRALVVRLARPRGEGGHVIERAAILAAGQDSAAVEAWILAHAGRPEAPAAAASVIPGLHGGRLRDAAQRDHAPRRFLLPENALDGDPPTSSPPPDKEFMNAAKDPVDDVEPHGHPAPERG